MSWTDTFPVMSNEMVEQFEALSTPTDKAELNDWYAVSGIHNAQDNRHVVSTSLFWKPVNSSEKPYPAPTREILETERESDQHSTPWNSLIQPVLETVPALLSKFDDITVRVYLASDLEFLLPDLVEAGCEVYLMGSPSLAHAPGTAWRTLAFSDKDRLITLVDADQMRNVAHDIKRTRAMDKGGHSCWREPVITDHDDHGRIAYRPFKGSHLGISGGWPMEQLLHAFTWHFIRGTFPSTIEMPGCSPRPVSTGPWPDDGFEKWFLTVAMYPRWAAAGMLTFVPSGFHSSLLLMDVEYSAWANPKNELVIFPSSSCCG
jgi:hypothetical protein